MAKNKQIDPSNLQIVWLQWVSKKQGELRAYAVNMAAPAVHSLHMGFVAKGERRALNGMLVPSDAEPALPSTPRDAFSERLVELRASGVGRRTRAALNPKAPKEVQEEVRAEKSAVQYVDQHDMREWEKAKRAAAKHPLDGRLTQKETKIVEDHIKSTKVAPRNTIHIDASFIMFGEFVLGKFDRSKVSGAAQLNVTDKAWGLYQNKRRVAFGRISSVPENFAPGSVQVTL